MKKYDILVVTYNSEKYLNKCIDSIVKQTYKNFDLIIVDDGSTDNTKQLVDTYIKEYDNVKYYYKENTGVADSRNYAISLTSSEYFTFVDSDDYISTDLLKKMNKYTNNGIDIVSFDCIEIDELYKHETPIHRIKFDTIDGITALLKYNNIDRVSFFDVPWGYFYRTEYFKSAQLKYVSGRVHEDILLTPIAISKAKTIKGTDFLGYYYVQTSNSITRDASTSIERFEDLLKNYTILYNVYKELYDDEKITLREYASLTSHILSHLLYMSSISDFDTIKCYCKLIKKYKIYKFMPVTYITKILDRFIFHHFTIIPILMYNAFYGLNSYSDGILKDKHTLKYMYALSKFVYQNNVKCPNVRYRFNRLIFKLKRDFLMCRALVSSIPALNENKIFLDKLYIHKHDADINILKDLKNLFKLIYKVHTVYLEIDYSNTNIYLIRKLLHKYRIAELVLITNKEKKKNIKKLPRRRLKVFIKDNMCRSKIKKVFPCNFNILNTCDIEKAKKYYLANGKLYNVNDKNTYYNLHDISRSQKDKNKLLNFLKD